LEDFFSEKKSCEYLLPELILITNLNYRPSHKCDRRHKLISEFCNTSPAINRVDVISITTTLDHVANSVGVTVGRGKMEGGSGRNDIVRWF
jgi:hypothetical protein